MTVQNPRRSRTLNRRAFLKTIAVSGGAAACGTLLAGCSPAGSAGSGLTLDLTQPANQSLATVGGTLALDAEAIDPQGILLYRSSETAVLAFSRKCTHQGCTVGAFEDGVATCPCHRSQFSTDGNVVRGPARNPLHTYTAVLSGSTVTISG